MYIHPEQQQREAWRRSYPSEVGVLISIAQLIFTMGILGCEIAGMIIDFSRMNVFVGYWACPFFTMAWISVAGASCCCLRRGCGITALVFQCLAIPATACVIGFNAYFVTHPDECFFSSCSSYFDSYLYPLSTSYGIKIYLIWGQLAGGILMLLSILFFIVAFVKTNNQVKRMNCGQVAPIMPVYNIPPNAPYTGPYMNPAYGNAPNRNPAVQPSVGPSNNLPAAPPRNGLVCNHCGTPFPISLQNRR